MRTIVALTALLMSSAAAFADTMQECRTPDPTRAIEACTRVVQSKGETRANHVAALGLRALAHMRKQELDIALADLKRALGLDPKDVYALSLRGDMRANRLDRALVDLNAALKLNPAYYSALANRGHTYVRMGDYARAAPRPRQGHHGQSLGGVSLCLARGTCITSRARSTARSSISIARSLSARSSCSR